MDIFKKTINETVKLLIDFYLIIFFLFKKKNNQDDFLILTGSDSTHFNSLVNLLTSISKYEKNTKVKIFNLGLTNEEKNYLLNNFDYKLVDFEFNKYPEFVSRRDEFNKLGSYSWKPIIIYEEYKKNTKNLIWLDAGCLINKNLKLIKNIILKNGFYSPQSSDNVKRWTHESTLVKLKVPKDFYKKRNISGGICGFSQNSTLISNLISDWHKYSINEEIISPSGSSRLNHRQDQALLTLLVHFYKLSTTTPRGHNIFGILRHQDDEEYKYLQ